MSLIPNESLLMARSFANNACGYQRGESMIEVIVTVIILSIGLLGAATLQLMTLKNLSSSNSISVAALMAEDFSDRLRANKSAAARYIHNSAPSSAAANCSTTNCTPDQLASYDIDSWWQQVKRALPSGGIEVTSNGANGYILTVRWDEDRSGSTGTNCPTQTANDLECQQLNVTLI